MGPSTLLCCVVSLALWVPGTGQVADSSDAQRAANLRARVEASPTLPFRGVTFEAQPLEPGWQPGAVSSVAINGKGEIYELQRGDRAQPIVVLNRQGRVLRSWGKGDFAIPHSIRLDPEGNVWTVDAGSSTVIKYSALGKKLRTIRIEGQRNGDGAFTGTTDIAFGPNGHLFVTDGYANARVLEYDKDGTRLGQWGRPGAGPGEFDLPHAIQIGGDGTIYVADRENGRIEEFNLSGRYLREIDGLGRVYALKLAGDRIWATMGPLDFPAGSGGGWLVELDRGTGRLLGHIDLPEARAGHDLAVTAAGEPVVTLGDALLWFQPKPAVP